MRGEADDEEARTFLGRSAPVKGVGIALRVLLVFLLLDWLVELAEYLDTRVSWANWPIREALGIIALFPFVVALLYLLIHYGSLLLRFLLAPLRFLSGTPRLRAPRVGTLAELNKLDGHEFEAWLVDCFRRARFECEYVGQHGQDMGADIIVKKAGRSAVIQAKRWTGPVGHKVLSEVYTAKHLHGCDEAWIITTSRFTRRARESATALQVRLYGAWALERWIRHGWPTAIVPPPPGNEALLSRHRAGHGRALVP